MIQAIVLERERDGERVRNVRLGRTSGRFKSYRSGGSRIILRARSLLMTFIILDKSSCIIFAVVRSTLLLLHFLLHSLFFS